jgi:hypothetical protein
MMDEKRQRTFERLLEALRISGDTHRVEDLMAALRDGRAQAWDRNGSLVVTEIIRFPRRTVLRYWLAAGDIDDMVALLPTLEQWGRDQGADVAECEARRGWTPYAAQHGYKPEAIIYRKDIRHGW